MLINWLKFGSVSQFCILLLFALFFMVSLASAQPSTGSEPIVISPSPPITLPTDGQPDIAIVDISAEPVAPGSPEILFHVTIKNLGTALASCSMLSPPDFGDGDCSNGFYFSDKCIELSYNLPTLEPGDSIVYEFKHIYKQSGTYTATFSVSKQTSRDPSVIVLCFPSNGWDDSDLSNNAASKTVTISNDPTLSDLTIVDVFTSSKVTAQGEEVTFKVAVKNIGTAYSVDYKIKSDFGNDKSGFLIFNEPIWPSTIAPGEIKIKEVRNIYSKPGVHIATFEISSTYDSNLENNKASKTITTTAQGPGLASLKETYNVGEAVNFKINHVYHLSCADGIWAPNYTYSGVGKLDVTNPTDIKKNVPITKQSQNCVLDAPNLKTCTAIYSGVFTGTSLEGEYTAEYNEDFLKDTAKFKVVKSNLGSADCQKLLDKVKAAFGTVCSNAKYDYVADVNGDKIIDIYDVGLVGKNFNNEVWCSSKLSNANNPCVVSCTDTDNGIDVHKQGTCSDGRRTYTDKCYDRDATKVYEYICSPYSNICATVGTKPCDAGEVCVDGACVIASKKSTTTVSRLKRLN